MVLAEVLELPTRCLQNSRSTTELSQHKILYPFDSIRKGQINRAFIPCQSLFEHLAYFFRGQGLKLTLTLQAMDQDFKAGMVALIGRPNVGKSTLLNALLGQKIAITSHKPQTTRNRILGVLSEPGFQAVLLDTPGIHAPKNELHRRIVGYAHQSIEEADLVMYLAEPLNLARGISPEDKAILERLAGLEERVFLVLNKVDEHEPETVLKSLAEFNQAYHFKESFPVSALKKWGLEAILGLFGRVLPVSEPLFDPEEVTDQPERVLAAEFVREQLHRQLHQEIPYGVAVVVERFKEEKDRVKIWAVIHTEKESHKKIIIGKGGLMLKQIGTGARKQIENLLGTKVYLDLHVKVSQGWVEDPTRLTQFGYLDH